jgi:integral membrane protein
VPHDPADAPAPDVTAPVTGAAAPAGAVPPKVRSALGRYRVAAFVVGVGLLLLIVAMVLRYGFDQRWAVSIWGPIHGVLYIVYVLLAFDLAYKDRWSAKGTILVLLAGVIPVLSFWAERLVTRKVLARQKI